VKRLLPLLVIGALAIPAVAVAAMPQLPDHAAETVAAAHAKATGAAQEFASEKARGLDPDKTTGLARAAQVSSSWRFTGADKPGNGNGKALGVGHSDAVHEALANGQSPSSLENHGEQVSAAAHEMIQAYQTMKNRPADESSSDD
jgi:hypothetical protein